jgi:hypothetical protein
MTADPQDRRELAERLTAAHQQLQSDLLDVRGHLGQAWYPNMKREADEMRREAYHRFGLAASGPVAALLRQPSEGREPDGWIDVHDTRVRITDGAVAVTLHKRRSGHATVPVYIGAAPTPEPEP